jgi:tripartite-type tricarboxylate transporter receptor subunit TctC
MKHRRSLVFPLVALVLASFPAPAQERPAGYPSKPIRVIVGIAPAGGLDLMTRLAAQKITERWSQTVIVDNRPGGGTVIAMDIVAQAAPDGYTLLAASDTLMMNGVLRRSKYDVRKAFIPIVQITRQPYVLVVNPSVPVKSLKDLIAYAKSKPAALNYGSQGPGTTGHIGMERFKAMAGIDLVHVPYKGAAPALMDLIAGQIQVAFSSTATGTPHFKSGKVRPLAVTSHRRSPVLPDLPTVAEAGLPGFELHNSYGYFAPAGTLRGIVTALNVAVGEGMAAPETVKTLTADGSEIMSRDTPEEFKARFDREYAELEKLIRSVKINID